MLYLFKQRGFGIYICVLYTLINTNLLKSRTMCNKLHTSQVYPTPLLLCFGDKLSVSLWFVAFEFEMCRLIIKISFEYKNTNKKQRFLKAQHADNFSETIMSPREIAHTELKVWNKVKPTVRLNKSTQIAKTVATYIWPTLDKKKNKKTEFAQIWATAHFILVGSIPFGLFGSLLADIEEWAARVSSFHTA